ncbi:MAG: type 1 glutamine amidotransferase [Cyanobacteriota bacterium]
MNIHYLQHVPFENLANIETWARQKGYCISKTAFFNNNCLPNINNIDCLIILGGPMNVYEEDKYPWLVTEKRFIETAIANNKKVIGICLGAQLIASVLGSTVYTNRYKEIGWFPVCLTSKAFNSNVFKNIPSCFTAFHWHGDTFDLPDKCIRVASSEGCLNQAFEYNSKIIGLQFHLEYNIDSIYQMIDNCSDEIIEGKYIQTATKMIELQHFLNELNDVLVTFLNNLVN